MRGHGLVSSAGGLGAHDHVCWPFADGESFRRAALEFLSDGRRLGQRLMYVGDGPRGRLAQHGVKLTIRGAPSWVRRICDVLGVAL